MATHTRQQVRLEQEQRRDEEAERERKIAFIKRNMANASPQRRPAQEDWPASYSWTKKEFRENIAREPNPVTARFWAGQLDSWESHERYEAQNADFRRRCEEQQARHKKRQLIC